VRIESTYRAKEDLSERTMEVAGATVTVIPALVGGVVGVAGDGAPLLLTVPVQPAASHTSTTIRAIQMCFTACPPALTRSSPRGKQSTTIDTACESRRGQML
jgi:2-hydroxychromene-2-carboxylate isomerase